MELGIDDPEAWLDSISDRVFDVWWAFYQCEPFGRHWEQTASIASTVSTVSAMISATHGIKSEGVSVLDFMPSESMPWMKRKARRKSGITSGAAQAAVITRAFGF